MWQALFHIAMAMNYVKGDKKLTQEQKNEILVQISYLISHLNEKYYNNKFKVR